MMWVEVESSRQGGDDDFEIAYTGYKVTQHITAAFLIYSCNNSHFDRAYLYCAW